MMNLFRTHILLFTSFYLLVSAENLHAQSKQSFSVHGTIKSQKTGEAVIGATISVIGTSIQTTSNEYGFYSLTAATGAQTIQVTAIGMLRKEIPVSLQNDLHLDISLEEVSANLEEVVVTAKSPIRNLRNAQMGAEKMNVQEIRNIPVLFGERDILKTIQLLPGVKSAGDGNSGFYVRGGGADENLILLDEATVYNASHLLGFFSTFNSDAIKDVTIYKGTMPPQYGGRLSSVVDVKMNDGNNQQFGGSGGIGLIASRLNLEGPIQKDKSSFLISGRRTYADLFIRAFGDSSFKKTQLYFYDLNTKMNFTISEKDHLFLSGYFGRDVLRQDKVAGIDWGNKTGTLRWNHIFNQKLFSNTSLIYSNYDYDIDVLNEANHYGIISSIRDWNLKQDFQWYRSNRSTITTGLNLVHHVIKPGEVTISGGQVEGLQNHYAFESAIYANHAWKASDRWSLNYGIRISGFSVLGPGDYYNIDHDGNIIDTMTFNKGHVVKTYINPEPRASAAYSLNSTTALKLSLTRNVQNLHLLSNSTSGSPTDKWIASTNNIKPETADQVALGYYKNLKKGLYELTVETYYKAMHNQIDYRNGAEVFSNVPIETQLLFGKGRAYGIEFLFKKKMGRLTGWISYTLSKTERQINEINNGSWYPARQDRTHDIAIVGIYNLSQKWTLSGNWIFYTGDAVTYPSGKYTIDNEVYFYYSERNAYRMPNYHRLDISATKQLKQHKRFSSELNFSIFNLYGRANAYQVNFRESETDPNKTEAVKTSLFTFVPSISYNFKF
jgi:hypothetical protein